MNATLAISVLVLAGWTLPDMDQGTIPLNDTNPAQTIENPLSPKHMPGQGAMDRMPPMGGGRGRTGPAARGGGTQRPASIPHSPTAPDGGAAMPVAPTSSGLGGGAGAVGGRPSSIGMSGAGGSSLRGAGGARQQPFLRSPYAGEYLNQSAGLGANAPLRSYYPQISAGERPHAGVTHGPAISPWHNLYRRDTTGGLDNYNAYVRPDLEQRQMNSRFGNQINGVQQQGAALQHQMNQENMGSGFANPKYFIDYKQFYPSTP